MDKFLTSLVLPLECVGCGKTDTELCPECATLIMPATVLRCPFCARQSPAGRKCATHHDFTLDGTVNAGYYHDPVLRNAIAKFKFASGRELVEKLGNFLSLACRRHRTILPEDGIVMPIPLLAYRERKRGYNQAALLAPFAAQTLGLPCLPNILKRKLTINTILANSPQSQLDKDDPARWHALSDAFYLTETELIKGQNIILVDDVLTSGASLEMAARTLKTAGVKEIFGLVLARG